MAGDQKLRIENTGTDARDAYGGVEYINYLRDTGSLSSSFIPAHAGQALFGRYSLKHLRRLISID